MFGEALAFRWLLFSLYLRGQVPLVLELASESLFIFNIQFKFIVIIIHLVYDYLLSALILVTPRLS